MSHHTFFDTASTTPICPESFEKLKKYSLEEYANPSSSHKMGQVAFRAIREAKNYFSDLFQVTGDQIVFTSGGTESDNLAIYGTAMARLANRKNKDLGRILVSSIEHPAVIRTAFSLVDLGFEVKKIPVLKNGQIDEKAFQDLLTQETFFISIMTVNNILGNRLQIEKLAEIAKSKVKNVIFHSDAIQAFGKTTLPAYPSPVDLLSLSAHKIEGPKGIGALIFLNKELANPKQFRPLFWGGDQENGMRSGTQSAALISAFHAAAVQAINHQKNFLEHTLALSKHFQLKLKSANEFSNLVWNSPDGSLNHIVSISLPGIPISPFVKMLEEKEIMVSTGSACSSGKDSPDSVLCELGLIPELTQSAIRISFSKHHTIADVDFLVDSMRESILKIEALLGSRR